jgi:hypothetical protein
MLTNIYGAIMKGLKESMAQLPLKKTLHVIDSQNMSINAKTLRFKPRMFFFNIDDFELLD